jgi:hypothetical protein
VCACCTTRTNISKKTCKKVKEIVFLTMQGRKELTPKMLYQVHLQDLIPEHNFYRLLDRAIDFHFLYRATAQYYGEEGQELRSASSNTSKK